MNIRIAFRGMSHSPTIEERARKDLEKLFKLLKREPDPIYFDLVLQADGNGQHHAVELRLNSKHYHLVAKHEGPQLYEEIDHVVRTMGQEIKKHHEKFIDKRNHTPDPFREPINNDNDD